MMHKYIIIGTSDISVLRKKMIRLSFNAESFEEAMSRAREEYQMSIKTILKLNQVPRDSDKEIKVDIYTTGNYSIFGHINFENESQDISFDK